MIRPPGEDPQIIGGRGHVEQLLKLLKQQGSTTNVKKLWKKK